MTRAIAVPTSSTPMSDLLWCRLEGRTGHEAGRALLAELYRARTGQPLPQIATTDRGKPYLIGSDLHFSITHTKKHAFCALSDRPIGIDAEELDRNVNLKLAAKILSPSEAARWDGSREMLLRFWVLKEAQVKRSGEGLRGFPNQTDFDPRDPRIQIIDGCLLAVLEENDYAF